MSHSPSGPTADQSRQKIPANVKGLIKKLGAKFFIAIYRHQSIEIQRVKSTHIFAQFFFSSFIALIRL